MEGKCKVGSPFSKAVMQRVMMKYGLCMQNRDCVESSLCMWNEVKTGGKCKAVLQRAMMNYG